MRLSRILSATKVINLPGTRRLVVVGIIRERLFGPDTVEESLKVIDNISSVGNSSVEVLVGLNDQEFGLIKKSMRSRNSLKGRFMSPVVALCSQGNIPVEYIGRRLTSTSSRLSSTALANPWQFYKLLMLMATKSWSLVRTPSARDFLNLRVPSFADAYLREGSACMALNILQRVNHRSTSESVVTVVPLETCPEVLNFIGSLQSEGCEQETILQRIAALQRDGVGVWMPVLILYILLPCYGMYRVSRLFMGTELTELSNYETQGIALGTWVRDKRRD